MSHPEPKPPGRADFPTTCWPRVVAAGDPAAPEARSALADLCAAYWYPIYAFIRRQGRGPEEARDLTQDYFARLLERRTVAAADPARGRFRSFLMVDCARFLADRRERDGALKRGGGVTILPIDAADAEGRYGREPAHVQTPERLFTRAWALALLDEVLGRLRLEYQASGRGETFDVLGAFLSDGEAAPYADLAARLGSTAGAVQVAVHRLRRRYRALVRSAIEATIVDPADVDDELRDLLAALVD